MQEMQETLLQSLGREDPRSRKWQLTPVFLPGNSMDRGELGDYSPWGFKRVRHNRVTEHTRMHSTNDRSAQDAVGTRRMEAASSLEAFLEAWCIRVVT